jgi:hypothetical protein
MNRQGSVGAGLTLLLVKRSSSPQLFLHKMTCPPSRLACNPNWHHPRTRIRQSSTQDREMPSRSPDRNRTKSRGEATHPDGRPPRWPDHDLVTAAPVLGHLEPRPLLRAMPHAYQPEQDEHRRFLLPRKSTDQTPSHPPPSQRTQAREHTSAHLSPRVELQPPTNLVSGSRASLPPALHYHRLSRAMQRTAAARVIVGTAQMLRLASTTPNPAPPSLLSWARGERKGKGKGKSRDTYGVAEQEQRKAPRLFVPRPFRCAPSITTTTLASSQQARSA